MDREKCESLRLRVQDMGNGEARWDGRGRDLCAAEMKQPYDTVHSIDRA